MLKQRLDPQSLWLDHAGIAGQRSCGGNEFETVLDELVAARSVPVKEGAQSGGTHPLKFFQGGPTLDEGSGQGSGEIFKELEGEWEVELQRGFETLQSLGALINEAAPILTVLSTLTHRRTVGTVVAQSGVMFEEELDQKRGVDRIALCAGGIKRLAITFFKLSGSMG